MGLGLQLAAIRQPGEDSPQSTSLFDAWNILDQCPSPVICTRSEQNRTIPMVRVMTVDVIYLILDPTHQPSGIGSLANRKISPLSD